MDQIARILVFCALSEREGLENDEAHRIGEADSFRRHSAAVKQLSRHVACAVPRMHDAGVLDGQGGDLLPFHYEGFAGGHLLGLVAEEFDARLKP